MPFNQGQPGCEYFIDFSVRLKQPKLFLEEGYEVAHDQFALQMPVHPITKGEYSAPLNAVDKDKSIDIKGQNF